MPKHLLSIVVAAALAVAAAPLPSALAGNAVIQIVGSSTMHPFSAMVAERWAAKSGFDAPQVRSTGSGGGIALFCQGPGDGTPDIANASRRMNREEQTECFRNGVAEVIEIKVGYDGIVLAQALAGEPMELTRQEVFLALAREVVVEGKLVPNPHRTWQDVNPNLPAAPIRVYGPPATSGTRDAFSTLVLERGCFESSQFFASMWRADREQFRRLCRTLRSDGAYIEQGEDDHKIVGKLTTHRDAIGVFGYSFLEHHTDEVRGVPVEGMAPEFDAIVLGSYPVSRPLFMYVKKLHIGRTPGLAKFVHFFVQKEVIGEDGFLTEEGLIPLPQSEYDQTSLIVKRRKNMRVL